MARLLFIAPILGLIITTGSSYNFFSKIPPPNPELDLDAWWGPSELKGTVDTSIMPFNITFSEEMLNDLKYRIQNCRTLVPPYENGKFDYGFNTNEMSSWLTYWAEEYPFSEREEFLNQFPQYQVYIGGLKIHYIRYKPEVPAGVEIVPVLLVHGWPGSVREFYEAIPFLTAVSEERDFAIEVIVPSIPGYGFSDAAVRPGLGTAEVGVLFAKLMQILGFEKYYVQGGDMGAIVTSNLATLFPERVLGCHINTPFLRSLPALVTEAVGALYPLIADNLNVNSKESNVTANLLKLKNKYSSIIKETGYLHIQATKPDTVGIGLTDSPAGLLAYILEKFSTWTDGTNRQKADGGLGSTWTKDQLIDNVMMYWTSNCITTSMRLYAETYNVTEQSMFIDDTPTTVPTRTLQAKNEILYYSESILKLKYHNLINSTILDYGGHFIAFEMPKVLAEDVITTIGDFRRLAQSDDRTEL